MYYIAVKKADGDVVYIYRSTEPKIGAKMTHAGEVVEVIGYMPAGF